MSSPKGKTCLAWESIIVTKLKGKENTNHSLSNHKQASVKGEEPVKRFIPLRNLSERLDSQTQQSLAKITGVHEDSINSFFCVSLQALLLCRAKLPENHVTGPYSHWLPLLHSYNLNLFTSAFTEGTYNK